MQLQRPFQNKRNSLKVNQKKVVQGSRGRNRVKSVRVRSYSGPHFLAFGLNTERYSVSLRIQSEYGKMPTRIISNMDTFYVVRLT